MAYKLSVRFMETENSDDPRAKITLADGADAPIYQSNVPLSVRAITSSMVMAQQFARDSGVEVDVSEAENWLRVNHRGMTDTEIEAKVALMRLRQAAEKRGFRVTETFDLEKI